MADDKANRGPSDRSRINLEEDYEVRYWMEALGISRERLHEVVKDVGSSAAAVRERLGKSK